RQIFLVGDRPNVIGKRYGLAFSHYDLNGSLLKENLLATDSIVRPKSIIPLEDGGYYISTKTNIPDTRNSNLLLLRVNDQGDILWSKKYANIYPKQTILTSRNELLVYGWNYSPEDEHESNEQYIKVLLLSSEGNLIWEKELKLFNHESPETVIETKQGKYLFSCIVDKHKLYVFRLDRQGNRSFRKPSVPVGQGSYVFLLRSRQSLIEIVKSSKKDEMGRYDLTQSEIHVIKLQE
ncbi:MAG: hypothetical protein AAF740_07090, partial [Bacteroidota bacterium]